MLELALVGAVIAGQFALCMWMGLSHARAQHKRELDEFRAVQENHTAVLKNHGATLINHDDSIRGLKNARTKGVLGG